LYPFTAQCILFERGSSLGGEGHNTFMKSFRREVATKPNLLLDVLNVPASVEFYRQVFGVLSQKQFWAYAKFDLASPGLHLALVSSTGRISSVNHLGIEVETIEEVAAW